MKILFINSVCGIGSTGKIVVDLAREASKQGHQCWIAYGRGDAVGIADNEYPRGEKKENCRAGGQQTDGQSGEGKAGSRIGLYKTESNAEVLIHVIMSRLTDRQGFYSKMATKRFATWIRKLRPDIIHLHNIHGYYLHLPTLFDTIKDMNVKVVWTLHDCWAFTGHCSHFDYRSCNRWRKQCFDCPQKKEYPTSFFMEQSKRNFLEKREMFCGVRDMTIVTPSKWLAELVEGSFLGKNHTEVKRNRDSADKDGMGGYRIQVINNGIDLNVFRETKSEIKKKYGIRDKRVILGVASQWSQRKGLRDFVRLSRMLDKRYQIVLIGLSKKQLKQLPTAIIGIERTSSGEELAMWYTAADVFVNPTYEDTYSMVNVEALSCNTPVVTYRTGGAAEMLSDSAISECKSKEVTKSEAAGHEQFIEQREQQADVLYRSQIIEKGDVRGLYRAIIDITKHSPMGKRLKGSADREGQGEIKGLADEERQDESRINHAAFSKERMLAEYMSEYLGDSGVLSDK